MSDDAKKREEIVNKLRDYQRKVAGWIKAIWHVPPDDDYEQSDDYRAALDFYRQFKHQEGVDYSGVVAYARELYERYDKTDKTLDDKADSIIKYLGGGSALITFGALVSLKTDTFISCVLGLVALACLAPSLVSALCAVQYAIRVRRPRSSASLPNVKFAVEMAEYNKTKEETELNLWLIFYPICEAAYYRNLRKARLVDLAHKSYLWAMGLLVIPVIGISICLIVAMGQADKSGSKVKQGQIKDTQGQTIKDARH